MFSLVAELPILVQAFAAAVQSPPRQALFDAPRADGELCDAVSKRPTSATPLCKAHHGHANISDGESVERRRRLAMGNGKGYLVRITGELRY